MSSTTRTRPPGSGPREEDASGGEAFPSLASWEEPPPLALEAQVQEAREARGPEREAAVLRLHERLEALGAGGGSREVADQLLHLLESGELEGLESADGRTSRSVAVEALLELGFPYALEVRPEDLEHLRQSGRAGGTRSPLLQALAALSLGGGFVGEWWALPPDALKGMDSPGMWLVTLMGLSLLALVTALSGPERSDSRRTGLMALAVLSIVQLSLGVFGNYHGLGSGLAGLLAWLLLMLPRR